MLLQILSAMWNSLNWSAWPYVQVQWSRFGPKPITKSTLRHHPPPPTTNHRNFLKDSRHIWRLRFYMYDPPRLGIRKLGVNSTPSLVKEQCKGSGPSQTAPLMGKQKKLTWSKNVLNHLKWILKSTCFFTHITPLGTPISTVMRVSDGVG